IYFFILGSSGWILESTTLHWMFAIVIFMFVAVFAGFLFKLMQWESFRQLIIKREEVMLAENEDAG
ncbi:MAG: hypothetical protein WBB31_19170, partial [Saprospiraceae bacterium]